MKFSRIKQCVIIFGAYERFEIAQKSLVSLTNSVGKKDIRIIVSDASKSSQLSSLCQKLSVDYIWTPGDVSMAASRDLAYKYAQYKYVFDWVLFVEDDMEYGETWYDTLLAFAENVYGKKSPFDLVYGVFSAGPGIKSDETVIFDDKNNCFAQFFGPRADQRLFKANHYSNVVKSWDPDLLGISSPQTGLQIHRNAMRGFCSANISHLNLCQFVDGEVSTWQGLRDIGPAAFDKRLQGYRSVQKRVVDLHNDEAGAHVSNIAPESQFVMTELKFDEKISFKKRLKKLIGK